MKKWIAALLAMLLVISLLAGCSSKNDDDDDDDEKSSQSSKDKNKNDKDDDDDDDDKTPAVDGVAIDTIVDKPEKIYPDESENIFLDISTESPEESVTMQIGMTALSDDSIVIYFNDGPSKTTERVIEISADGSVVTGYIRADGAKDFIKDTESTVEELLTEATDILALVESVAMFSENMDGAKLRKVAPIESKTGKVYSYAIVEDGKDTGMVSVDQSTGLVVYLADETFELTVNAFDLTDAKIPEYKSLTDGVAVGTLLEQPEIIFNGDNISDFFVEVEMTQGGQKMTTTVGLKGLQSTEGVIFIEGKMDSVYNAMIVEVSATGTFNVYRRTSATGAFVLDTTATKEDVEEAKDVMIDILEITTDVNWEEVGDQLRKIESVNANVYTYEILVDGQVDGTISVNKDNGMVMLIEGDGLKMAVTRYSLTNHNIPSYK